MGEDAKEDYLKTLSNPPDILHLATHGFFCELSTEDDAINLGNTLLRSGLALAGANAVFENTGKASNGSNDGILTAYEVSAINLLGTDLVVLSACETGIGDIAPGEGVLGLRRAFRRAGAQSILMSLWKIPDKRTSALMHEFYQQWLSGKSKRDALRDSVLESLRRTRAKYDHSLPYLWSGFILAGNPN
jgi:CHAT domain-containing protein